MLMDEGMDTGDILLQKSLPIRPDDTAGSLSARLAEVGGRLLIDTIVQLQAGTLVRQPQDNSRASMAPLLKKEDGLIDWTLSAPEIERRLTRNDSLAGRVYVRWGRALDDMAGRARELYDCSPSRNSDKCDEGRHRGRYRKRRPRHHGDSTRQRPADGGRTVCRGTSDHPGIAARARLPSDTVTPQTDADHTVEC